MLHAYFGRGLWQDIFSRRMVEEKAQMWYNRGKKEHKS